MKTFVVQQAQTVPQLNTTSVPTPNDAQQVTDSIIQDVATKGFFLNAELVKAGLADIVS